MEEPASPLSPPPPASWLGAFAHPAFAVVWFASTAALIGIAMFDTTSGWLMTTLDLNPLHVSLVHVATNLPMFLFTLPAGAIADIVNPRRLITLVSCAIAALISIFAALVSFDLATPVTLLLTTFVLSGAWALNSPAWLSILPNLVPKRDLPGAMAAHSVGYNLEPYTPALRLAATSSSVSGVSAPFWLFVATNFGVIAALIYWKVGRKGQCQRTGTLPAERLQGAVRTGIRHAANNRLLRATLIRTLAFLSLRRGLLGAVASHSVAEAGHGAEHYGLLLSMISAGAVFGSFGQKFLRERIDLDWMVVLGTIGTALALAIFAWTEDFALVLAACFCAGSAWVIVLTSLYMSAQNVLPEWVRGRGLAIFLTAIFGTMSVGSASLARCAGRLRRAGGARFWRRSASSSAVPATWRWKLQQGEGVDLSPSLHWSRPETAQEIPDDRGPVLVKIEYRIDPEGPDTIPSRARRARRGAQADWLRMRVGSVRGHGRVRPIRGGLSDRDPEARAHASCASGSRNEYRMLEDEDQR